MKAYCCQMASFRAVWRQLFSGKRIRRFEEGEHPLRELSVFPTRTSALVGENLFLYTKSHIPLDF